MNRPLRPELFDRIVEPVQRSQPSPHLWGVKQIATFLQLSSESVRRIKRRDPTFPVVIKAGRHYANRINLTEWLAKDDRPSKSDS